MTMPHRFIDVSERPCRSLRFPLIVVHRHACHAVAHISAISLFNSDPSLRGRVAANHAASWRWPASAGAGGGGAGTTGMPRWGLAREVWSS